MRQTVQVRKVLVRRRYLRVLVFSFHVNIAFQKINILMWF